MKVSLFSNQQENSQKVTEQLREKILSKKISIDDQNPDIVLSIGGDGTLLNAFAKFQEKLNDVKFIGVHTGHLGFYTDWVIKDEQAMDELVNSLNDVEESVAYPVLNAEIVFENDKKKVINALNEVSLRRLKGTVAFDISIGNEFIERFRGDGLVISTPTGSTAYNKAVGGAIVQPSIKALQISEIAPLNNRVYRTLGSPLIVGSDNYIDIQPIDGAFSIDYDVFDLNIDSKEKIKSIRMQLSKDKEIHFAQYRHLHFWERARQAFIGSEE